MRVLFYMPSRTGVRGGISVILDMIDALNRAGFEALALYERPDFEYNRYVLTAPRLWLPGLLPPHGTPYRHRSSLRWLGSTPNGGNTRYQARPR